MARQFLRTMLTPGVRAAQQRYYPRGYPELGDEHADEPLGPDELAFVAARDSFYMATVTENGWPYLQHRGGPKGFLVATSRQQLAFADYGGNRQLISTGSIEATRRANLFLMDYGARRRLKILGTAEVLDARDHPGLVEVTAPPAGHAATPERIVRIDVHAFDWNCPQHIPERFTRAQVDAITRPLQQRIRELERELAN